MHRSIASATAALTIVAMIAAVPLAGQVRGARRGTTDGEGHGAVAGPRGVAAKTEDGYAAASRRGAVVQGDEGYAAVGRRGAVASGEDGYARVGPRGAVVAGEEGVGAVGRRGVVVGNRYESYEGWKIAAGVCVGIAIGTMLARPPKTTTTVVVSEATYYYADGAYYTRVMSEGTMVYQVVAAPAGAVITTLPAGCTAANVGGKVYTQCGTTHYEKVSNGYRVVVLN